MREYGGPEGGGGGGAREDGGGVIFRRRRHGQINGECGVIGRAALKWIPTETVSPDGRSIFARELAGAPARWRLYDIATSTDRGL